jgi:hypothetical protein
MNRDRLLWVLVGALTVMLGMSYCSGRSGAVEAAAVARAEGHQAALDSLAPITEALRAEAQRRDTLIVHVTDTLRVVIERAVVVAEEAADSLHARLDSVEVTYFAEYQEATETRINALEVLLEETRLWGQSWKDAAEALEVENRELRLRGDAWEEAYEASRGQNRWLKVGQAAAAATGFALGKL